MGLLNTSFEIYELYLLLTFVLSANLICLIVNQWVKIQDSTSKLKKIAFFKHKIMIPLNSKKALNRDLIINKCNQWI